MAIAKLTFNLPKEQEEFEFACQGSKWYSVVFDMDNWLRSQLKYGHKFTNTDEALEQAREYLRNTIYEKGLHFE